LKSEPLYDLPKLSEFLTELDLRSALFDQEQRPEIFVSSPQTGASPEDEHLSQERYALNEKDDPVHSEELHQAMQTLYDHPSSRVIEKKTPGTIDTSVVRKNENLYTSFLRKNLIHPSPTGIAFSLHRFSSIFHSYFLPFFHQTFSFAFHTISF